MTRLPKFGKTRTLIQAERQLRILDTTLSSTEDFVYILDLDGKFTYANQALLKLWGLTLSDAIGKDFEALGYPSELVELHRGQLEHVVSTRNPLRGENPYTAPNGQIGHYEYIFTPVLDKNGQVEAVAGITRDITTHKRTEQKLRDAVTREAARAAEFEALMDAVPAIVFLSHDPECRRITGNRTASILLRVPLGENLSIDPSTTGGPAPFRVFQDDEELPVERLPAQRATRGEHIRGEEWEVRFEDGTNLYVFGDAVPLYDDTGKPRGSLATMIDITDRKKAEQRLQQMNETLEQRVAERTAEADQRADQLQRLAVQLTEVEQRERRRLAQLLHDDLQQILVAAKVQLGSANATGNDEARNLLEQAIETSRSLSTALAPPVLYDLGLNAALEWLVRWVRDSYDLVVEFKPDGSNPVENEQLRVLLFNAVRELLLNVVKHANVDKANITLERQMGRLRITVKDFGTGFDPGALNNGPESSGYGLFSMRERLELIGGEVKIDSAPGKDTKVQISVPLPDASSALEAGPDVEPIRKIHDSDHAVPPVQAGKHVTRVLLTDDHDVVRQGLANLIDHEEDMLIVAEAASGESAIELTLQHRPDVVVMDISLPGISGIEATQRIMTELPNTHVIVLSMHKEHDVAEALKAAGARGFVNKGQATEKLLEAIRRFSPNNDKCPGG